MRIHVMSDLHFEQMSASDGEEFFHGVDALKLRDPADLLVLAGDICQVARHEGFWKAQMAQLCSFYKKVLYVPGNHEYYESSFEYVDQFIRGLRTNPNLHNLVMLHDGPFTFNGVRFVGDTMWFPDSPDVLAKRMMPDFRWIGDESCPFEPTVYGRHYDFIVRVAQGLRKNDVVLTHHLPLPGSIDPRYRDSPLNPFFLADMTGWLEEAKLPQLWVHGHTHVSVDYVGSVGNSKMRTYCNPRGYPGEYANPNFWSRIGIDIPDSPVVE